MSSTSTDVVSSARDLNESAWSALLRRLNEDPTVAAAEYELIRKKLIGYFDARALSPADVLADEAIDRVAHRLGAGEEIRGIWPYFLGVARFLAFEAHRRVLDEQTARRQLLEEPLERPDLWLEQGLARCLKRLPRQDRMLILAYYRCDSMRALDDRQRLADEWQMTYGMLKTRVHRIRRRLAVCLRRVRGPVDKGLKRARRSA